MDKSAKNQDKPAAMIIAVDGPAASGKGTLARLLAASYGLAHLDTGLLYRAVGVGVLQAGGDPADETAALKAVSHLVEQDLDDPALRTSKAGGAASQVAAIPAVRTALLEYQRRFANSPPGDAAGAVLDGRDIGTVVCPNADIKFFIKASPEVRARRRYLELSSNGSVTTEGEVLADILERDARDANRDIAPMVRAPAAYLIDTSDLSIEAAFAAARAFIDGHLKDRSA